MNDKQLNAILVNETNTPYTSIGPYRLTLTFTLFFFSERSPSNDYEHSMYGMGLLEFSPKLYYSQAQNLLLCLSYRMLLGNSTK